MADIMIDAYNGLVDFMNELVDRGIRVDEKCDSNQGYGFYANCTDELYVELSIFYVGQIEYCVNLMRRGGKCWHDCITDVDVDRGRTFDVEEAKQIVNRLIAKASGVEREVTLKLSESEAKAVFGQIIKDEEYFDEEGEFATKLKSVLEKLKKIGIISE